MTGTDGETVGTGGSKADPGNKQFPAVPYTPADFHENCGINNYKDADEIRKCELSGLKDLDQVFKLNVPRDNFRRRNL